MVQFPWSSSKGDEEPVYSEAFDISPAAAVDAVRDELVPRTCMESSQGRPLNKTLGVAALRRKPLVQEAPTLRR